MNSRRRWRYALGALALSLGIAGVGVTAANGDEISPARIIRIDIECKEPIDPEALRRLLPFDVGDVLGPGSLDEARHLLELREVFESVAVDATPAAGGMVVLLRLRRLPLVNLLSFVGNDALGYEELRRLSRLRAGSPLTAAGREYATERIREAYEAEGFSDVRVEAVVVQVTPGEIDVRFDIVEGEPLLIAAVDIGGVSEQLQAGLADEIEIRVGDRYAEGAQHKAEQAIVRRMRERGYYEARVVPAWMPEVGRQGRLTFDVEPGPLFEVEFRGNDAISSDDLLETVHLPERPIITDGTWRELARRAVRAYQEKGYEQAKVTLVAIEKGTDPTPTKIVRYGVKEGGDFRVREVNFEGNEAISAARLRSAMETRPPSWIPWVRGVLIDEVLAEDLKRIVSVYHRRGFLSARIRATNIDHEGDAIFILIEVQEGRQVIVRELELVGLDTIAGPLPPLQTRVGEPFDREQLDADRRALGASLAAAGYINAVVGADATIADDDTDLREASVKLSAKLGQQVRIGTIIVQNNFDTRAKVVLSELPFRSGDVLGPDQLLQGQGDVYKLGLFRSVTVRAADDTPDVAVRDVVVRVAEKPPGTFQWGVGYNTRDGFRGVGQVGYHNLQGLNRSISLRGQVDVDVGDVKPNQYLADLSYRMPQVLDTRTVGSLKLVAQRSLRDIDDFKLERLAFIPGIERPLWELVFGGVALQIDETRVFDLAADIAGESGSRNNSCVQVGGQFIGSCPFDDEGDFFSVSIDPFLVRNALDDEFRPTRGMFESLGLRFAPSVLGTKVPLVKIVGQHSHYIPLGDFLTFVYAVRVGWARALDGDEQAPIQERFFLGGRTTVRGYAENSVGPEARCDPSEPEEEKCPHNPLGGDVSINLNGEVQFPLLYGFGGAVFVDGGGVYLQTYNAKGENFREGAGIGLRYMTPVGPLSLDYGFKVDRRDGESLGQISFSVGRVF